VGLRAGYLNKEIDSNRCRVGFCIWKYGMGQSKGIMIFKRREGVFRSLLASLRKFSLEVPLFT
jgi:hypothetical protein